MNKIKVSVIVLTYNHVKYVRQAIESVLMQEVSFSLEIIIADDKSTDNTQKILEEFREKYPDLIKLILQEKNVGTTKNICDAFRKSKGEYIVAFGGDDYWIDQKKLQIQVNWLDNHPDYIGVSHIIETRNNDGQIFGRFPDTKIINKNASVNLYLKGFFFSTSSTLFRNIFQGERSEDYYNLITKNLLVEDFSLAMILLNKGQVFVMDRCMAVYRKNYDKGEGNYNSIRNPIQAFHDHIDIYNANAKFFRGIYDFSWLYAQRSMSTFIWSIQHGKFFQFYTFYKNIPAKAKAISLIKFPMFLLVIILNKFMTSLLTRKTKI